MESYLPALSLPRPSSMPDLKLSQWSSILANPEAFLAAAWSGLIWRALASRSSAWEESPCALRREGQRAEAVGVLVVDLGQPLVVLLQGRVLEVDPQDLVAGEGKRAVGHLHQDDVVLDRDGPGEGPTVLENQFVGRRDGTQGGHYHG